MRDTGHCQIGTEVSLRFGIHLRVGLRIPSRWKKVRACPELADEMGGEMDEK